MKQSHEEFIRKFFKNVQVLDPEGKKVDVSEHAEIDPAGNLTLQVPGSEPLTLVFKKNWYPPILTPPRRCVLCKSEEGVEYDDRAGVNLCQQHREELPHRESA